jgi:hypothetical protein
MRFVNPVIFFGKLKCADYMPGGIFFCYYNERTIIVYWGRMGGKLDEQIFDLIELI